MIDERIERAQKYIDSVRVRRIIKNIRLAIILFCAVFAVESLLIWYLFF